MRRGKVLLVMLAITALVVASLSFTGCDLSGGSGGGGSANGADYTGSVFKGPFVVGSTVTAFELTAALNQTGASYSGDIVSDTGEYNISDVPFIGPVELVATGFYFDEVTGNVTGSQLTLRAITEVTGGGAETVNINLATAIERDRVKALVDGGMTFTAAKAQALGELWGVFGWTPTATDSTAITVDGPDGGKLLALSAMIATGERGGSRSVTEIVPLITSLRVDFANGSISQEYVNRMIDSAFRVDPENVRSNLQSYYAGIGQTITVPLATTALNDFLTGEDLPVIVYDDGNFIRPALAGARAGEMGMGRTDGFTLANGETLTITITGDTDYFNVTAQDFTETSPGVYEASGLAYHRLGVGFANIQTDVHGTPDVPSYTVTITVSGVDSFQIVYTVTHED